VVVVIVVVAGSGSTGREGVVVGVGGRMQIKRLGLETATVRKRIPRLLSSSVVTALFAGHVILVVIRDCPVLHQNTQTLQFKADTIII